MIVTVKKDSNKQKARETNKYRKRKATRKKTTRAHARAHTHTHTQHTHGSNLWVRALKKLLPESFLFFFCLFLFLLHLIYFSCIFFFYIHNLTNQVVMVSQQWSQQKEAEQKNSYEKWRTRLTSEKQQKIKKNESKIAKATKNQQNLAHQSRTIAIATISALTEPNCQKSRRKKGFWAQKSQI